MAGPAWAVGHVLASRLTSPPGRVATMLLVSLGGAGIYFAAQAAMGAEQMQWLSGALRQRWVWLTEHVPGLSGVAERLAGTAGTAGQAVRRRQLDAILLLAIVAVGALAGVKLKYAVGAALVFLIVGWVMARPAIAAYLLIFLTPLIVSINVGSVIPLIRPNEALMILLGVGLGLRWLVRLRSGEIRWPRIERVDLALIALGVTSSVLPLAMMLVRQRPITKDDLLYCLVLWKLFTEYIIVRSAISTREQATRCLWLSMAATAIVGAIGILQSLGVAGVPALVAKLTATTSAESMESIGRGSSLLGLPDATADLAILNLGIAVAMLVRGHPRRRLLAGLCVLFALSVFGAAEFAAVIGLVVAVIALLVLTKSGRFAIYLVPVGLLGGVLLWPVIELRLSGFHSTAGLPLSWVDRLYNLRTFFLPVLFSDHNWILGVRPSPRIATSTKAGGFIWLESGYLWLLWGGGIPLLASYIAFAGAVIRKGLAYVRRADVAGIAATAVTAAMFSQVVLMVLDPHLTNRGSGDALFLLLALIRKLPARRTSPAVGTSPRAAATAAPPQKVLV